MFGRHDRDRSRDYRDVHHPAIRLAGLYYAVTSSHIGHDRILAMRTTRSVARRRATIDLIEKTESTDHYRQTAKRFSMIRRTAGMDSLTNPRTDQEKDDRAAVVDYLNHYELISIGILNDTLDERIYRQWMRGPFTRDWNAAANWIQRERWKRGDTGIWEYYDKVFVHYQTVARRWSKDVIELNRETSGPPSADQAGGPGEEALPAITDTHAGES